MSKSTVQLWLKIAIVVLFLLLTGVLSFSVYARVRAEVANSDILPDFTLKNPETALTPAVQIPAGETLPLPTSTDRVTVLILGIDERAQETDFWRSDTMILATLDPVTMQAGVLSIPRDLWVPIPGYTENRINTAHALGDAYDHPGGGPALAIETVRYNLGIEVDYYVRVNFQAFVDMVDLIGGIDIDVPETINDPTYPDYNYGYDPLYVEAGPHHFYGEEALKYARTRHSNGGDFDRARRQQQVIRAILKRITDANLLPQLAARAPEIAQTVEKSAKIDPNLQLDQIIALANLASKVKPEDIHFYTIDETCTMPMTTPDQAQILVPLRDKIREVRDQFLGLINPVETQAAETETATVSILNGTQTAGLASTTSEYLTANKLPVAAYANADRQDYDTSLIILNRNKPATAERLLALLHLPKSAVVNGANPTAEYDVVVILGADYQTNP